MLPFVFFHFVVESKEFRIRQTLYYFYISKMELNETLTTPKRKRISEEEFIKMKKVKLAKLKADADAAWSSELDKTGKA